jgi:hypothetical protein
LRAIQPNDPVQANFFVMGNAAQMIENEVLANDVSILNHGRVAKPEADAAVGHADILLNIGEAQGRQISSKVFEYMSTGKPIIHLAYVAHDPVSKILSKYPLALCLLQDRSHFNTNVQLATDFISKNRRKVMPYDEVEKIYPEAMPETTAEAILELLKIIL